MTQENVKTIIQGAALAGLLLCAAAATCLSQVRNPVIFVPGLSGSELRNPETKERIWFSALKPRSGRISLPLDVDPLRMRDHLVATDAVRRVWIGLVPFDVYGGFLKAMVSRGGYHEEKWDKPSARGATASIYVFA